MPKDNAANSPIDRRMAFSALIDASINKSSKAQNKIAGEIGYTSNANVMTMFKKGVTRLPLDKVVPLAKAVGGDPSVWLKMWFEAYMPDVSTSDLEKYMGFTLSQKEKGWVYGLRRLFDEHVPTFTDNLVNTLPPPTTP